MAAGAAGTHAVGSRVQGGAGPENSRKRARMAGAPAHANSAHNRALTSSRHSLGDGVGDGEPSDDLGDVEVGDEVAASGEGKGDVLDAGDMDAAAKRADCSIGAKRGRPMGHEGITSKVARGPEGGRGHVPILRGAAGP